MNVVARLVTTLVLGALVVPLGFGIAYSPALVISTIVFFFAWELTLWLARRGRGRGRH